MKIKSVFTKIEDIMDYKLYYDQIYSGLSQLLNPIPTGCCHVTLIYGLIPPMAGRNRVKQLLNGRCYGMEWYVGILKNQMRN